LGRLVLTAALRDGFGSFLATPETKVILCLHPSGHHSVLAAAPDPNPTPDLLSPITPNNLSCFDNYAAALTKGVAILFESDI